MDIEALIKQMTLEEKAALCTGADAWTTTPIERLGIPALRMADGPHGVRRAEAGMDLAARTEPATCFPTAATLGATWNPALLREVGQALGEECRALGVNVLLGPGVNMKRTPLCGRNFEYLAEDPFLAGQLAASLTAGVQSQGVGASLKHFAANNQELNRFSINALVDERALREIYLPAFETVVKQAKPWTVMGAYNKLNGAYCSQNARLLTEILKREWGFEGLVVSDWGAVHDRVDALQAGLDLEMPGPQPARAAAVVAAARAGLLPEAVIDEAVRRILGVVFQAAAMPPGEGFDAAAHHALARRAAAEGMVLLKNNGALPLKAGQRVVVIGPTAQAAHFQGGGSSHVNALTVDSPLAELEQLGGTTTFSYVEGYAANGSAQPKRVEEAVRAAQTADAAVIFAALPEAYDMEGNDRPGLDLPAQQVALIRAVGKTQPRTVVVLNAGSAVAMSEWLEGAAAVVAAGLMGEAGGGAVADVLLGKVNPSGRLAETYPLRLADTPAYLDYPGANGEARYGEGLYIGYRYYDAREQAVLFPFGHGLSYTTFAYGAPRASANTFTDTEGVTVSVAVTNTGPVAGQEVVQLYVHDHQARLARPPKELKGFAKVALAPGETQTVRLALDGRAFAYYDPAYRQWVTEDGEFDLLVGASAGNIRGSVTVTLQSTLRLPSLLNRESTLREWLADKRGRGVIEPLFQQMRGQITQALGGEGAAGELEALGMVMDTPVRQMLEYQEQRAPETLPAPAAQMVEGLLHQVHNGA